MINYGLTMLTPFVKESFNNFRECDARKKMTLRRNVATDILVQTQVVKRDRRRSNNQRMKKLFKLHRKLYKKRKEGM